MPRPPTDVDAYVAGLQARGVQVTVGPRVDHRHVAAEASYQDQRRVAKPKNGPTEDEFIEQVIDLAHLLQWKSAHFRAARTTSGWRTAVSGDGKGFCDLLLARDRVVYAELKVGKGRLSPEQKAWSDVLKHAGQEVYLWKPENWEEIERILT